MVNWMVVKYAYWFILPSDNFFDMIYYAHWFKPCNIKPIALYFLSSFTYIQEPILTPATVVNTENPTRTLMEFIS